MNEEDILHLCRVLKKVDFNEEDFTFYILYSFIINHYPNTNIQELEMSEEVGDFKDRLLDVLDHVKKRDYVNKSTLRLV
jgi:hypothetical protein